MNYIFTINDKEYEAKLTTMKAIKVEKKLGKNPLLIFSEGNVPSLEEMVVLFSECLSVRPMKDEQVYELVDEIIEEKGFTGFILLIVDILKFSGFLKSEEDQEEEGKN